MSYPVFYASEPELKSGLSEEESFHACRVLRLKMEIKFTFWMERGSALKPN